MQKTVKCDTIIVKKIPLRQVQNMNERFHTVSLACACNTSVSALDPRCGKDMCEEATYFRPSPAYWGIPFDVPSQGNDTVALFEGDDVTFPLGGISDRYIVFLHSADCPERSLRNEIMSPFTGVPPIGAHVADYIITFEDGSQQSIDIRMRYAINAWSETGGNGGFECRPHKKPAANDTSFEEIARYGSTKRTYGRNMARTEKAGENCDFNLWLYAWENKAGKKAVSLTVRNLTRAVIISGITGCDVLENPLRWERREKMCLDLNDAANWPEIDAEELERLRHSAINLKNNISIDMGAVISVRPHLLFENENWLTTDSTLPPKCRDHSFIVEFSAHPDAHLFLGNAEIPLKRIASNAHLHIEPAREDVTIHIIDKQTRKRTAVKFHAHGRFGEYLAPRDRQRYTTNQWFEDFSADYTRRGYDCCYVDGEVHMLAPKGKIYVDITKGFEIKPYKAILEVDENHTEFTVELEHTVDWRSKGWVTADTHVHFLSPMTAQLEGAAEGINVVNLLASQWGEMFTNAADFDGKTTIGSKEAGGDGEYLVRVGTENRQQVMGHISLVGYEGDIILPLATGAPDEAAIGDALEAGISDWAKQCRDKNGINILPHIPNPYGEGSASVVLDLIDAVEVCCWNNPYGGISPYSLSDWYHYLNCGYQLPCVGGTDKMDAMTELGAVRTYAHIKGQPFTYDSWKQAITSGDAFVTFGPLIDMQVNGADMGSVIDLPKGGGTLDVTWTLGSAIIPVTSVELVVNGKTREVKHLNNFLGETSGSFSVFVDKPSWIAILIRGKYKDGDIRELIAAHSSSVMCYIEGQRPLDPGDALEILEQIEGISAYVQTLSTRAEEKKYKQILMNLTAAHRALHNRMHAQGMYHTHGVGTQHEHPDHNNDR